MPASSFKLTLDRFRAILSSRETVASLSGADLFALAYAMGGVRLLNVDDAIERLHALGLTSDIPAAALRARMITSTANDRAFLTHNERTFCLDPRAGDLALRLGSLLSNARILAVFEAPRARAPRASSERAPARSSASPRAPATRPGQVAATGKSGRPASPWRPDKQATPAKPAKAASPPAPSPNAPPVLPPDIAPPAPFAPATVTFSLLDEAEIERRLKLPEASLASVGHVLRAHALASAEQFEELLALRHVTGVEPHRYQTETVRRVLRFFRGRALLADEVGLGKTVEALLILREYQLRGMVRRALIVVPPALLGQWVGELSAK
ncbi:MAG: SNF2-related protein, partial [Minicystis sp.]